MHGLVYEIILYGNIVFLLSLVFFVAFLLLIYAIYLVDKDY